MNAKYHGPAIFPPAAEVKKQVEAHLESLRGWDHKPSRTGGARKKSQAKPRKQRRRP